MFKAIEAKSNRLGNPAKSKDQKEGHMESNRSADGGVRDIYLDTTEGSWVNGSLNWTGRLFEVMLIREHLNIKVKDY